MSELKEKYIGESGMLSQPSKKLTLVIADGAVTTDKIGDESVTPEKLSPRIMTEVIEPTYAELQTQINNINHGNLTDDFGNRKDLAISQDTLTKAINALWQKIESITGENLYGINMTAVPNYFVSTEGCNVTLSAFSSNTATNFDKVTFYVDGVEIGHKDNTSSYTTTTFITDTVTISCTARILGIDYTETQVINYYKAFWMGAGTHYSQIMNMEHLIPITETMRDAHDVVFNNNDHLIIVMGKSMVPNFIRADINGFEIQFEEPVEVVVDNNEYAVLVSKNTYKAGTYNVDING